jgi:uncharacterized FlaG/YvyC family protein
MIEAVNSVLQSAPVIRGNAEKTSTSDSFAANPQSVQKVAQAPYVSPYITVDVHTNTTVLQIRDSATGKVVDQIPSKTNLETQQRDVVTEAQQQQVPLAQTVTADVASPSPAPAPAANTAATAQQVAAFANASRAGNVNAGSVTLFA